MAIEPGSAEYYSFLYFGQRSLGLTLKMLASNYRYRVLVSELDQEEIWGYTSYGYPFEGFDVPQIIKAWSIELDWCDNTEEIAGTITLTSVFKEILRNIGKTIVFGWDKDNDMICVAIVDPNWREPQDNDLYEDCFPTPDELDAILELDRQKQLEMLTDVGLFNPETGELSNEYYIMCDRVFDASR